MLLLMFSLLRGFALPSCSLGTIRVNDLGMGALSNPAGDSLNADTGLTSESKNISVIRSNFIAIPNSFTAAGETPATPNERL